MDFPIIAAVTASIITFLKMFLAFRVGFARLSSKVSIGDGGNESLNRQIRVHGNLIEYAPIFLILLTMLELSGIDKSFVQILAGVFILARISHAYGLSKTSSFNSPFRALGAGTSSLTIIIAAALLLHRVLLIN